jgi:DNA end-binding protein Ku
MARALWSGSISFGLVNIPVKLVSAVSDRDLHFHMLHAKDGARIRFKRVCPKDDEEVAPDDIVKGYELSRGQYVTFTADELEQASPEAARTIDISGFVEQADIDPAYYERPYYLVPDKGADKAYALLLAALKRTRKVGIARVVMRDKEYLVAIRPRDEVIMMETMHFADEVVPPSSVAGEVHADPKSVDKRQLALAEQLIESLSGPFEPEQFENRHRERLLAMVEQKAAGKEVVAEPQVRLAPKTVDIMAALEDSLKRAKGKAKAAA